MSANSPNPTPGSAGPRRLRRAEAVLSRRTARILLVLEGLVDEYNVQAVLRTAEAFGVQHVWSLDGAAGDRKPRNAVSKGAWRWLSIRRFREPRALVQALRQEGRTIWATDLAGDVELLERDGLRVPERLAVVLGREADGVGKELLAAADRRIALPMHGFSGSYNVNVAAALILQRLFDACPEARGDLDLEEQAQLRARWYRLLARTASARAQFPDWLEQPPPPLAECLPEEACRRPRVPKHLRRS